MCRILDGKMKKWPKNSGVCRGGSDSTWRTEINRQLALLLERVDLLGYAIDSVAAGVANIEGQIKGKGRNIGDDGRVRATNNNTRMEARRVNIAPSNASGG